MKIKHFLIATIVILSLSDSPCLYSDENQETTKEVKKVRIKIELYEDSIGLCTSSTSFCFSVKTIFPGPGSIENYTGWSYRELRELGEGTHFVIPRRTEYDLWQGGPGEINQVACRYAIEHHWQPNKAMPLEISFWEDGKSLLLTWHFKPEDLDALTSTVVMPGEDSVDGRMTGWTYDELLQLGKGKHAIQRRRVGEKFTYDQALRGYRLISKTDDETP